MATDLVASVVLGGVLGAGARGGLSGIRTAGAVVQGVEGVRAAEQGRASFDEITEVLPLATRSGELQRAMIEKGC